MSDESVLQRALQAADATEPVRDSVARILRTCEALIGDPILDAALSEYSSGELGRVHSSLWLFTERFAMEASLVNADEDDLDFAPVLNGLRHVVVGSKDYDWSEAVEISRVRVEFWFEGERYGEMRASGTNCDWVRDLVRRTLLPNVAALAPAGQRQ